jgi:urea transporter
MASVTVLKFEALRILGLLDSVLYSYSQVLFTRNRWVGLILLAATFLKPMLGLMGLAAVLFSFAVVRVVRFSTELARGGVYGYNPLLLGLALGAFLEWNAMVGVLLLLCVVAVVFLQTALESAMGYFFNLPVLSLPFVLVTLLVLAAVPFLRDAHPVAFAAAWTDGTPSWLPAWVELYLRSLGAIFFQPEILAGLVVLAALLVYSRIAVILSWVGFAMGHWLLVQVFDFTSPLVALIVGYNFILTAVALGGVWFVPQRSAFLLAAVGTLIAGLLTAAALLFLRPYQLPVLILPFNLTVILVLYAMRQRVRDESPKSADFAVGSPEANLHYWQTRGARFGSLFPLRLRLPFQGAWTVTQGVDGPHTHQGMWRHAWDFEVRNASGKTHDGPGTEPDQYLCYRLPVLAVADGTVVKVVRDVPDNPIGQRNARDPWGNLVVIQHGIALYSLVCHLAPDSIRVAEGQFVRRGSLLGLCGNSGRSFVPHLHVQFQATPRVGAPTVEAEFHDVVAGDGESGPPILHRFLVPADGMTFRNLDRHEDVAEMFAFPIGGRWRFKVTSPGGRERLEEVVSGIDLYNNLYLQTSAPGARLFFENQNHQFLAYDQQGSRTGVPALLLAAIPRVPYEQSSGLAWDDVLPRRRFRRPVVAWFRDLLDPFLPLDDVRLQFLAEWSEQDLVIRGQGTAGGRTLATEARFRSGEGPRRISVSVGARTWQAELQEFDKAG